MWSGVLLVSQVFIGPASAADDNGRARFRDTYRELIETNTTLSSGDCTLAASRMAARLKAVGYPGSDLHIIVTDGHPKEGSLVAVLPGSNPHIKALLLLGHLDVVEAKREDWTRDPFKLVEENGYFYGRGAADMKSQDAIWVDIMVRLKEGKQPRRTVKLAMTCGEENVPFNGARWLVDHERALVDAEFALTEGGWGEMDANGKRIALGINAGEKLPRDYELEVTSPGGHAMRPIKDNAIVRLGAALVKINGYDFPVQTTQASQGYFARMAPLMKGEMGTAMAAFAKDPTDTAAQAVIARDPAYNAMMRTTCTTTLINGGHATNAQPQRATANLNCRLFPGTDPQAVRSKLSELAADPRVTVTAKPGRRDPSPAPPLTPAVMAVLDREAAKTWPGVPVIPKLEIGATDASHFTPAGIPTYGFTGLFFDPDGNGMHGLNERMRVEVLYQGRDFLWAVVNDYLR